MRASRTPEKVAALEARAHADYAKVEGKLVWIRDVCGYDEEDNMVDLRLDPPGLFRVEGSNARDLTHWSDDWLDPYWELTLMEEHPQLAHLRSFWSDGPSYCLDGSEERGTWEIARIPVWKRVFLNLKGHHS